MPSMTLLAEILTINRLQAARNGIVFNLLLSYRRNDNAIDMPYGAG
jgi:hypothetical protein